MFEKQEKKCRKRTQEKNAGKVRYWLPVARFVQSGEAG